MDSAKGRKLGGNPLNFLKSNNLINPQAMKKCIHLKYSKDYKQHYCVSPKSRQRGFLGKKWQENCGKCYVKEVEQRKEDQKEALKVPKKFHSDVLKKLFNVR